MKKLFKKNQMVITALVVMVAAAGYYSYSDSFFRKDAAKEVDNDLANVELLDISEEDLAQLEEGEIPGEAVLTNGTVRNLAAQAKMNREQVRAKNKETLQAIIDDEKITDNQKTEAINQMVEMTQITEKETAIENMLAGKGFTDTVVNLTENGADIMVGESQLSDAKRAQIEDIVVRKADITAANIVITPMKDGVSKETETEK